MKHISKLLLLLGLVALLAACTPAATPVIPATELPLTEANLPRVSASDARAAFDSGEAVIVDVRDTSSYLLEHVAGALSIPLLDIEDDPTALPLDKTKWIITYCTWPKEQSSARAALVLLQNGYPRVSALLGGLQAWENAGYPIEP